MNFENIVYPTLFEGPILITLARTRKMKQCYIEISGIVPTSNACNRPQNKRRSLYNGFYSLPNAQQRPNIPTVVTTTSIYEQACPKQPSIHISTMLPNIYLHFHVLVQSIQHGWDTNTTLLVSSVPVCHVLDSLIPCT